MEAGQAAALPVREFRRHPWVDEWNPLLRRPVDPNCRDPRCLKREIGRRAGGSNWKHTGHHEKGSPRTSHGQGLSMHVGEILPFRICVVNSCTEEGGRVVRKPNMEALCRNIGSPRGRVGTLAYLHSASA
jgi:hypothetical protein